MYYLNVKERLKLVQELVTLFSGGGYISVEGELSKHRHELAAISGSSTAETPVLKRQTLGLDHYDFFVLPLQPETEQALRVGLLPRLGVSSNVYHIQVEKDGQSVFGAYDSFSAECVWITARVPEGWINNLKERGVLRDYRQAEIR